jgi:hypothetical protein
MTNWHGRPIAEGDIMETVIKPLRKSRKTGQWQLMDYEVFRFLATGDQLGFMQDIETSGTKQNYRAILAKVIVERYGALEETPGATEADVEMYGQAWDLYEALCTEAGLGLDVPLFYGNKAKPKTPRFEDAITGATFTSVTSPTIHATNYSPKPEPKPVPNRFEKQLEARHRGDGEPVRLGLEREAVEHLPVWRKSILGQLATAVVALEAEVAAMRAREAMQGL